MTPMLDRLSAASGHRFSIGVTSGLSRNRRLLVVVDALALTSILFFRPDPNESGSAAGLTHNLQNQR